MHELALVQEIVAAAELHARGAPVRRVVVEVGRLAAVMPNALKFCFDVATEGTAVHGAVLELIDVPGKGRCTLCGATVVMSGPLTPCPCGAGALEWLEGFDLRIKRLEVD
jgi:hydrogenase nickel incorporation protein HypA/HybF